MSVFLMRRAVRRARGLWYQHSFMTFASADSTWGRHEKGGGRWEGFVASEGLDGVERGCPPPGLTGSEKSRLGITGVCWSTHTTFFMSSKLGSLGTASKKGGW